MTSALFLRLVNILLLVLLAIWFARSNWEWEPLVAVIALSATMVAQELRAERPAKKKQGRTAPSPSDAQENAERARQQEHDARLFAQFLRALPSSGSIRFVRDFNMAGFSFASDKLNDFLHFLHDWDDPEHEFLDPELETARKTLSAHVEAYVLLLNTETFSLGGGMQTVPPEWEHEQPERFDRVVKGLHDGAQAIVDAHQELVRIGNRKVAQAIPL